MLCLDKFFNLVYGCFEPRRNQADTRRAAKQQRSLTLMMTIESADTTETEVKTETKIVMKSEGTTEIGMRRGNADTTGRRMRE